VNAATQRGLLFLPWLRYPTDMQSGRKFAAALFIPMGWAVVFRDS